MKMYRNMYQEDVHNIINYIIFCSCHNTTYILSFFSKPVLVWAYIRGTIPHIQCKIPSSLPPGFSTCKIFQFCPFYSFAVLTVLHGKGFIFSSSKSLSRWAGLIADCLKVGSGDSSLNKEQLHRPALRAHDHIYFVVIAMRSMTGSCDARHRSLSMFVLEVRLSYTSL